MTKVGTSVETRAAMRVHRRVYLGGKGHRAIAAESFAPRPPFASGGLLPQPTPTCDSKTKAQYQLATLEALPPPPFKIRAYATGASYAMHRLKSRKIAFGFFLRFLQCNDVMQYNLSQNWCCDFFTAPIKHIKAIFPWPIQHLCKFGVFQRFAPND